MTTRRIRLVLALAAMLVALLAGSSARASYTCIAVYASTVPDDVAKTQPICVPVG